MKTVKLMDLPLEWKRGTGLRKSDIVTDGVRSCVLYGELFTKHKKVLIDSIKLSKTNNTGAVLSKTGDILIPGTSTASKRDMILARELDKDGVLIGGDINIIRPKKGLFAPKYLAYFFETAGAYKQLERYITGTTGIIHISNTGIKNLEIPLPSLEEQEKIVAKLDAAFDKIDQVILLNERNLKDARKLWKSTLSEIFDKQHAEWNRDIIGELIKVTSSKRIYKSEYVKAGIPFYRTKEIKELANGLLPSTELFIGDVRYHEVKSKFGVPVVGDILLTAIGTIGEVYVIPDNKPFYFKDGNVLWLKESQFLDSYYLSYAIKNFINELKSMANGSAYNALPINKLKSYAISYPSLEQQKIIVKNITHKEVYIRKLESAYRKKANYLESLKRSMLNQVFSESDVK